jgi:hypothetical protein
MARLDENYFYNKRLESFEFKSSVADPDLNLDPSDPYVFGLPGSGPSIIKHDSKKNLDSFCFCDFFLALSLKNDFFKKLVFVTFLKVNGENRRIQIQIRIH